MLDKDTFADHFRHNLNTRSRTSTGKSDTSVSPDKPQLIGDEAYRKAKVAENTELLIEDVWDKVLCASPKMPLLWGSDFFPTIASGWAQINSRDLLDWPTYEGQVLKFCDRRGLDPEQFNPLWRTWDSDKYGYEHAEGIGQSLAQYFQLTGALLSADRIEMDLATVLGIADYLHDGFVHPWADACGRTSVAIVMFISAVLAEPEGAVRLPHYPDRSSLYKSFDRGTTGAIGFYADCLVEV